MKTEVTYRGAVYPWHCDHVGHMNVMWYVGKFDEATWNLFARIGLTPAYLRETSRGMAAAQQNITYKRELLAGDVVEVRSSLLEIGNKSIRFVHEMRNAETGEIAAICEITGVHLDRQARKSVAFTETIRRRAANVAVTSARKSGFFGSNCVMAQTLSSRVGLSALRHDRFGMGDKVRGAAGDAHAGHRVVPAGAGRSRTLDGLFACVHPAARLRSCRNYHRRPRQRLRDRRFHVDAEGGGYFDRGVQDQSARARERHAVHVPRECGQARTLPSHRTKASKP